MAASDVISLGIGSPAGIRAFLLLGLQSATVTTFTTTVEVGLADYRTAVLADAPIGYWPLQELIGTSISDYSGANQHGTYKYSATAPTFGVPGALPSGNPSVTFNGSDQWGKINNTLAAFGNVPFSVECFVKTSALPATTVMLVSRAVDGWYLGILTSGSILFFGQNGTLGTRLYRNSATNICDGAWHHVVGTWDGGGADRVHVYIDGVNDDNVQNAGSGTLQSPSMYLMLAAADTLGSGDSGVQLYSGSLDEVAIYDTELSAARVLAHASATWTDITADVRLTPALTAKYGINGGRPTDVVASSGEAVFALDNSTSNSAATAGYYSPNHASVRTGFDRGIPCRVSFTSGSTTYYKFVGRIKDIKPSAGLYGERLSVCRVLDFMHDLSVANLDGVTTETDQDYSALLESVLNEMETQPTARSLATGVSLFPYALIGGANGTLNGLQEAQRLALSEGGYIYLKGDTTSGGVLVGENRHTRALNVTSAATIANTMTALEVPSSLEDVINVAKVTIHPRRIGSSTDVLYSSLAVPVLDPLGSVTLSGPYRDPDMQASRVAGVDMIDPVSTTDYLANSASDGSGTNVTANLTVTATFGGTGVTLVVTNTSATVPCYVTLLQCRGTGLYDYDAPVMVSRNTTSEARYSSHVLSYDVPYQDDPVVGKAFADLVTSIWATPFEFATSVAFIANSDATLLTAALAREVGDRVTITETLTGVNSEFFINQVALSLSAGPLLTCAWVLAPAPPSAAAYWQLGVAGKSELGDTTTLWSV